MTFQIQIIAVAALCAVFVRGQVLTSSCPSAAATPPDRSRCLNTGDICTDVTGPLFCANRFLYQIDGRTGNVYGVADLPAVVQHCEGVTTWKDDIFIYGSSNMHTGPDIMSGVHSSINVGATEDLYVWTVSRGFGYAASHRLLQQGYYSAASKRSVKFKRIVSMAFDPVNGTAYAIVESASDLAWHIARVDLWNDSIYPLLTVNGRAIGKKGQTSVMSTASLAITQTGQALVSYVYHDMANKDIRSELFSGDVSGSSMDQWVAWDMRSDSRTICKGGEPLRISMGFDSQRDSVGILVICTGVAGGKIYLGRPSRVGVYGRLLPGTNNSPIFKGDVDLSLDSRTDLSKFAIRGLTRPIQSSLCLPIAETARLGD